MKIKYRECKKCNGFGERQIAIDGYSGAYIKTVLCDECPGHGYIRTDMQKAIRAIEGKATKHETRTRG